MRKEARWGGLTERLDLVLPALNFARSRSQATELIAAGKVRVDGTIATKGGARVAARSLIAIDGVDHYVSRAAQKLIAGLDSFAVSVAGSLALDVGASTGGFTQVLLERGASRVIALDVGHGQLVQKLRDDERVVVIEGCNARELTPERLRELSGLEDAPQIVVADVSFISLELVLPALADVAAADAKFVLLIKPQFEVGRTGISGGIVTDPRLAAEAVQNVLRCAANLGLATRGLELSPVAGEHGNREVLVHFDRSSGEDLSAWQQRVWTMYATS